MPKSGTNLEAARVRSIAARVVELARSPRHAPLRAQLEDGLREAVRSGRLAAARAAARDARAGG